MGVLWMILFAESQFHGEIKLSHPRKICGCGRKVTAHCRQGFQWLVVVVVVVVAFSTDWE